MEKITGKRSRNFEKKSLNFEKEILKAGLNCVCVWGGGSQNSWEKSGKKLCGKDLRILRKSQNFEKKSLNFERGVGS